MRREAERSPTFLSRVAAAIPARARDRGEGYFLHDLVELERVGEGVAEATVQGTRPYDVRLRRVGKRLVCSCTCPYFEREASACKHVWALVLALDEGGQLEGFDDGRPVSLEAVEPDAGYGEAAAEIDRDGAGADSRARARPGAVRSGAAGTWREVFGNFPSPRLDPFAEDRLALWMRRELLYTVSAPETLDGRGLALAVSMREPRQNGTWGRARQQRIPFDDLPLLPSPQDRQILAVLAGAHDGSYGGYSFSYSREIQPRNRLRGPLVDVVLPLAAGTGRLLLLPRDGSREPLPIRLDEGGPWEIALSLRPADDAASYRVAGELARGADRLPLAAVELALADGWFFTRGELCRWSSPGAFPWFSALRNQPPISLPRGEAADWLAMVLAQPHLPRLELPPDLGFEVVAAAPAPRLSIRPAAGAKGLAAELAFDYGERTVAWSAPSQELFDREALKLWRRDLAAEQAARDRLTALGLRPAPEDPAALALPEGDLPRVVRELVAAGWRVEAEGRPVRRSGTLNLAVSSGLDWFDLSAEAVFEGETAALPEILAALERGQGFVRLGDGSLGLLPEDWLRQRGLLGALGKPAGRALRFGRVQIGMLDALLAGEPQLEADAAFEEARRELARFEGVRPSDPPAGFAGTLREYQRLGLGWLHFLRRFGFGGCLADDMGLGKTVQVLALLAGEAGGPQPSLVVAPRSVVFNWLAEARRFAPHLRVAAHSGADRARTPTSFAALDLVITTYGLLREDTELLSQVQWNYVILDEAQAIKNADSQTARAARLLPGRHRLALSGTPIENHLGELWSLFEFLNPGLLGRASAFQKRSARPEAAERALLAGALRPFILRRTKEQVLPELPPKTEQTLFCDLEPKERRRYDELKGFYQAALRTSVEKLGWARSKIHVLEALLRLRQAACHPGLIDAKSLQEPSAKLEALLPLLAEVLEGGHKALVFSQFTSLLAIVRDRLDAAGTEYLYLDGQTRDREALVTRFQTDPERRLFLISLKAGGLGLNLTAADYVFLLDPWWNPAVEAQAIDRAHRIGQERHVFAYRLVARDTVEEKILALQETKRDLADSIINQDNSLIRRLTREDLELLLG